MTLSPDGLWWWNGSQWVSAVSPDGHWRWNGVTWVANAPAATAALPGRSRLYPTLETRPLQMAVVAFLAISAGIGLYVIPSVGADAIRSSPAFQSDSVLGQQAMDAFVNAYTVGGIVLTIGWNALLIVGTLLRWRWVYYVFMILAVFAALGLIGSVVSLAVNSNGSTATLTFINVMTALANVGLAVWMFRLWRERRTAWAMRWAPEV